MDGARDGTVGGIGGRLLAALLSLVLPGLGHAVAGHFRRAAIWLAAVVAAAFLAVVVGSLSLSVFLPALAAVALLGPLCALDAFFAARAWRPPTKRGWLVFGAAGSLVVLVPVVPVALAVSIRAFCLETYRIPSGSACPTLLVGDHIVVDKTAYRSRAPGPGDLVVHSDGQGRDFIRRVVAVSGQTVEHRGRELVVDGRVVPRRPLGEQACDGMDVFEETLGTTHLVAHDLGGWNPDRWSPVLVPEGMLYLLGDNRDNSHDSRMIGPVPVASVRGRARWRWYRGSTGRVDLAELR